jgi:hypothetical protein
MYFDQATSAISSEGAYGDHDLPHEAFAIDDRRKRIKDAADDLGDYVYETLLDMGLFGDGKLFGQEHIEHVARMIAVGMMAQYEHDEKFCIDLVKGEMLP